MLGRGCLWRQRAGARSAPRKPAKAAAQPQRKPVAQPPVLKPAQPSGSGEVEILAPEQGSKLRGTALVKVDFPNPMGYVMFRIDDRFAHATTPPFEMKWDTTSALDGEHVVSVDAYDGSARYVGSASVGIVIENAIPTPPNGVLLTVRFDEHDMLTRTLVARGELSGASGGRSASDGIRRARRRPPGRSHHVRDGHVL